MPLDFNLPSGISPVPEPLKCSAQTEILLHRDEGLPNQQQSAHTHIFTMNTEKRDNITNRRTEKSFECWQQRNMKEHDERKKEHFFIWLC
jgi:hypothetical protein